MKDKTEGKFDLTVRDPGRQAHNGDRALGAPPFRRGGRIRMRLTRADA